MNLLYLINRYPGASHSFIRREIRALEALGQSVTRVSIRPAGNDIPDAEDQREAQKTTVLLGQGKMKLLAATARELVLGRARFWGALRMAIGLGRRSDRGIFRHLIYLVEACLLKQICKRNRIDHVHAHFGTNPPAVALLCTTLGGPGYSFTVHGPEEFDRPQTLALDVKSHHARFVAAISSFTQSQLYRWCDRGDWSRIHLVRCGLDEHFLTTAAAAQTASSPAAGVFPGDFVCVGRLAEQKGQMVLLDALAQLRDEGLQARATLVGEGPLRAALETEIRRLRLEDRVTITGWADGERVRKEILAARALVLPSFAEGLPVVLMEALALGRPVISTYVAGIPELVTAENGWLIPAGSVVALAAAMRAAMEASPEALRVMGNAGAAAVRRQHSAATEAATLLELFGQYVLHPVEPPLVPVIPKKPSAVASVP